MDFVYSIYIKKVLFPASSLSEAPILVKIRSIIAALYDLHGTYDPICAIIARRQDVLKIVDLPPILGPVKIIIGW
jgi:hypothetical protein